MSIMRYSFNLFAFPDDYFESKTADELGLTEAERQELIKMKKEAITLRDDPAAMKKAEEEAERRERELLAVFEE